MDPQAQPRALRVRLYVPSFECQRLIDLAGGNKPKRVVETKDLVRRETEEDAYRLEVLGICEV